MNIVHPSDVLALQQAIVHATHGITDENGGRVLLNTIDSRALEMAALVALQMAVGDVVWPADRKIMVPRRMSMPGPFMEA